jgi:hypothetical protein
MPSDCPPNQQLSQVLSHALNVVEHCTPLRVGCCTTGAEAVQRDRKLDARISRIVIDNVKFSFWSRIGKASFQGVKQILVKKFQLDRYGDSLAHSPTKANKQCTP